MFLFVTFYFIKTFTLEKLDSTFYVRRMAFNKSRSKLAEISKKEVETFNIPTQSTSTTKRTTRATKAKNKIKEVSPENPMAETYEEESVEEFELETDNNNNNNNNNRSIPFHHQ